MNDSELYCSPEEQHARQTQCKTCEKFKVETSEFGIPVTKCSASGCDISMMITFKFKECPLEKW
jgi:hypothetical protein